MHQELLEIQIIMAEISRGKKAKIRAEGDGKQKRKDKKLKRSIQKIFNLTNI